MSSPDTSLISWSFALAALGYVALAGYLVSFGSSWRASLWARRSQHRLGGQQVLVTEVFLPDILRLK